MTDRTVTLFHAPKTRSSGVLRLLEDNWSLDRLERGDGEAGEITGIWETMPR